MGETIAVVAAGAMGAAIGARLVAGGARVITSTVGRSDATVARARAAGLEPATDEDLASADLFLSVVPPADAIALAERMSVALRSRDRKPLYLDLNAVSPRTVARVQGLVEATGAGFVDGGIVGPPPQAGTSTTTIYLSGPTDHAAEVLVRRGLRVKVLDGGVGAASALKLSYAGITKGLVALGGCMALAAERAGVGEALREELGASQPQLLARFARDVPTMLPKAYRWGPEMTEIARFIGDGSAGASAYEGLAAFYAAVATDLTHEGFVASVLGAFFSGSELP